MLLSTGFKTNFLVKQPAGRISKFMRSWCFAIRLLLVNSYSLTELLYDPLCVFLSTLVLLPLISLLLHFLIFLKCSCVLVSIFFFFPT